MPRTESNRRSRICARCGTEFSVSPCRVGKYCSRSCYHGRDPNQPPGRTALTRTCDGCGRSYDVVLGKQDRGRHSFCSRACANRWQSQKVSVRCLRCGQPILVRPSQAGRTKFCSLSCHGAWKREDPGFARRSPHRGVRCALRRAVWKRDSGICHVCHRVLTYGPDYHCGHIVDRCLGGADALENLVVMCVTCNYAKPLHRTHEAYERWREAHPTSP